LIHLIDISNPSFPEQIEAVEKILLELNLGHLPVLRVFNKADKLSPEVSEATCQKHDGLCLSALHPDGLEKLFVALEKKLWEGSDSTGENDHLRLTNRGSFDISNQPVRIASGQDGGGSGST